MKTDHLSNTNHQATKVPPSRWARLWPRILVVLAVSLISLIIIESLFRLGWKTYTTDNSGLLNGSGYAMVFDSKGRIWVGTNRGLSELSPDGQWTTYTVSNSELVNNEVSALAVDSRDQIWVGTDVGLSELSPDGHWMTYTTSNSGLVNNEVRALAVDIQDQIWVGTWRGLSVLDHNDHWTTLTTDNSGLVGNGANIIAIDPQGRIWIGTADGLSVLDSESRWTTYTVANSDLVDDTVVSLAFDAQGQTWVGTQLSGISLLATNGQWVTFTTENSGIVSDWANVMATDKSGLVWVGSDDGLSVYHPDGRWVTYTEANSGWVHNAGASSMAIDGQGRVWVETRYGLTMLDPSLALPSSLRSILAMLRLAILITLGLSATILLVVGFDALTHAQTLEGESEFVGWGLLLKGGRFGSISGLVSGVVGWLIMLLTIDPGTGGGPELGVAWFVEMVVLVGVLGGFLCGLISVPIWMKIERMRGSKNYRAPNIIVPLIGGAVPAITFTIFVIISSLVQYYRAV